MEMNSPLLMIPDHQQQQKHQKSTNRLETIGEKQKLSIFHGENQHIQQRNKMRRVC